MKVYTGPGGTKANPTKVPSMDDERIVGCICKYYYVFIRVKSMSLPESIDYSNFNTVCCILTTAIEQLYNIDVSQTFKTMCVKLSSLRVKVCCQ